MPRPRGPATTLGAMAKPPAGACCVCGELPAKNEAMGWSRQRIHEKCMPVWMLANRRRRAFGPWVAIPRKATKRVRRPFSTCNGNRRRLCPRLCASARRNLENSMCRVMCRRRPFKCPRLPAAEKHTRRDTNKTGDFA
jgi:hypothetical protein